MPYCLFFNKDMYVTFIRIVGDGQTAMSTHKIQNCTALFLISKIAEQYTCITLEEFNEPIYFIAFLAYPIEITKIK